MRGQLGISLTWFFAFIIIFFMMLVFLGVTAFFARNENAYSETDSKLSVYYNFLNFLKTKADFNGEKIRIFDLISANSGDNENRFEEFEKQAEIFLKNNFDIKKGIYRKAWIRIYDKYTEIGKYGDNKYRPYEAFVGQLSASDDPCDPSEEKLGIWYKYFNAKTYLFKLNIADRKIAMCVEYK